jgi:hypothetical protein
LKNVIQFPTQLRVAQSTALSGLRYRTIHGCRRAFIQAESGLVALLIHGIGDSADSRLDVIPTLGCNGLLNAVDRAVVELAVFGLSLGPAALRARPIGS